MSTQHDITPTPPLGGRHVPTDQGSRGNPVVILIMIALLTVGMVAALMALIHWLQAPVEGQAEATPEVILAPVVLIAVVVLAMALGALAIIFKWLGLQNARAAMGLPDGSIRAVIALMLIILFFVLSLFLFGRLQDRDGPLRVLSDLPAAVADSIPIDQQVARERDGGTDTAPLYTVTLRDTTEPVLENFAMQLLTTMSTLVVAVAAFYFGSSSVTTAFGKGKKDAEETQVIDDKKAQVTAALADVTTKKAELDKTKSEVELQRAEVDKSRAEVEQSQVTVEQHRAALDQNKTEIETARDVLEADKAQIAADRAMVDEAKSTVLDAAAQQLLDERAAALAARESGTGEGPGVDVPTEITGQLDATIRIDTGADGTDDTAEDTAEDGTPPQTQGDPPTDR